MELKEYLEKEDMMNFLKKPFRITKKIEYVKKQIKEFEAMSYSLGGCDLSTERVDKTRNLDAPFVKWIYKKIEAEERLQVLYKELDACQNDIIRIADELDSEDQRMVIVMKYLSFKSWSQIAEDMYSSISSVRRWHEKAISIIYEKMSRDEQG